MFGGCGLGKTTKRGNETTGKLKSLSDIKRKKYRAHLLKTQTAPITQLTEICVHGASLSLR